MKNLFAVLLASLMLFSFAACSSETDSSSDTNQSNVETVTTDEESGSDSTEETTDETDSETAADATDETGTDATDETGSDETGSDASDETGSDETGSDQTDETGSSETGSATNTGVYTGTADPAEEQTITGTILDATMNTVTIQTEDGEELSFSIPDDADETEVDGMTVGDTLEITYTGTIDGTDTSGATVVKLVQTSAQ